jgi:hypothetical protein
MQNRRVLLIVIALCLASCRKSEMVAGRYWRTSPVPSTVAREFPESSGGRSVGASTQPAASAIGVCFSGGGTRSATATLGELRGLHQTKLIDEVKYISSVSGGTWGATPYIFLPEKRNDEVFLGRYVEPSALTCNDFIEVPPGSLASAIANTEMPMWIEAIGRALVAPFGLRDNEWYGAQLERCLLQPFDLGGRQRFFTLDEQSLQAALSANPHLKRTNFILAHPGRPFFIAGGTIRRYDVWPWKWKVARNKRIPLEITPLYVGIPAQFNDVGTRGRNLGATYVDTFAYGADQVATKPDGQTMDARLSTNMTGRDSQRMNLADVMAISGGAPGEFQFFQWVAFPDMHVWSAANDPQTSIRSYANSDGGLSEDLGIMPLLARRVPKIICFVNSAEKGVPNYVKELFGVETNDRPGWHGQAVFRPADLQRLQDAVAGEMKDGKMLVHADEYTIDASTVAPDDPFNLHLQPDEKFKVKVVWFFLDKKAWVKEICHTHPQLANWIETDKQFKNLPHYQTFLNNWLRIIDPTNEQVNALAHLTSWTVVQNEALIRQHFK